MTNNLKISEAEWEVMNVIWPSPPRSVNEILHELSSRKSWTSRTVRTLIDRLVNKGMLRIELEGKRHLYWPSVSMEVCINRESKSFLDRVFGGEPASMLLHLVEKTDLSAAEIRKLKKLLTEKEGKHD